MWAFSQFGILLLSLMPVRYAVRLAELTVFGKYWRREGLVFGCEVFTMS